MEEYKILDKAAVEIKNVCSNCKKQLNVEPIFCVERDCLVKEICGRCVNALDCRSDMWRQHAYEELGKFLTFPCSNKKFGCTVVLQWEEVISHEQICTFHSTKCPTTYRKIFPLETCTWEGMSKELNEHIEKSHKNCFLNPPQIEWSDSKQNQILFTKVGTQVITIIIKYARESTYYCLLMINGNDVDSQCYRFQLEMFDEKTSNSIILRRPRLEPLKDILENINNPNKMLEIDLVKIKQMLYTFDVSGRFGIVRKSKKEIVLIAGGKDIEVLSMLLTKPREVKVVDEKMLQELECPVCNEYMIPPIFICKTGHSICNNCKGKVKMCPNCRDAFTGARNFTLEKLTTKVNYPCRNKEFGCSFITTSDQIAAHQLNCDLSEKLCLLTCPWRGTQSRLYDHIKTTHPNSIRTLNTLYTWDIRDVQEIFCILKTEGDLFRFSIKQNSLNSAIQFNIQQVNIFDDEPKFRYQIQIVDHSPLGLNLSFTNVCQQLTDLKTAHSKAIVIPWNLLQPFIFETRYFYYKILITKIELEN